MTAIRAVRAMATALLAAGLLALAACSSSTSSTATSTTTATSPSTSSSRPSTADSSGSSTRSTEASASTESSGTETAAACRLVTKAEAEAAFGEPAIAGTQSSDECWWSTANDLKTINVIVRQPDLDSWRQGHANDTWESVGGLGDEAFASKALDSIELRVGDTVYEVNVVYSTKGDPKAVVQQLAQTVASRV